MERSVDFLYRQQAPWQHGELSGKSSVRLHGSRHEDGKVGFFCFLLIGDHMFDEEVGSWISDEKWDPSWKASKNKTSSYDHWSDSSTYLNLLLPDTLTYLLIRYFNIPLRMKDDPFRLIGVIGSIQVRRLVMGLQNICQILIFHIVKPWHCDTIPFRDTLSGSEVCDWRLAIVPQPHRKPPEKLLDAILGWKDNESPFKNFNFEI